MSFHGPWLGPVSSGDLAGDDAEARHWWESIKTTYPEHFVASIATLGLAVLNSREDPQGNI